MPAAPRCATCARSRATLCRGTPRSLSSAFSLDQLDEDVFEAQLVALEAQTAVLGELSRAQPGGALEGRREALRLVHVDRQAAHPAAPQAQLVDGRVRRHSPVIDDGDAVADALHVGEDVR